MSSPSKKARSTSDDEIRAASGFITPDGCFLPAIVTPLTPEKELDEVSLRALVKHMYGQGIAGLYVGGNTGEGMVMPVAMRKRLCEVCVDETKLSGPKGSPNLVIVHVGHAISSTAIELGIHAKETGANSVSSMPPYVGTVGSFGQVQSFYTALCGAVAPLPVVGYHIPFLTGKNFKAEELCALMEIPGFCGYKFTEGDLYKMESVMDQCPGAVMLQGLSTTQVAAVLYGASGGITGGGGNLMPGCMALLHKALAAGDVAGAMVQQKIFNRVQQRLYGPFGGKMVASFKHYLFKKGIIAHCTMLEDPLLSAEEAAAFDAAVAACGCL